MSGRVGGMCGKGGEGMHGRGVCGGGGGMHGRGACVAGKTAIAVGGTHPTGMHSCASVSPINLLWTKVS